MPRRDRRVLQELIYERIKLAVSPGEILAFETDLLKSVTRAAPEWGSQGPRTMRRLLRRAWRRIGIDLFDHESACRAFDVLLDENRPPGEPEPSA